MNKLLAFYLPNIIKHTLYAYLACIGLLLVTFLFPMSDNDQEIAMIVFMWMIFPMIAYFSPTNYLSSSLSWILQTPVKKGQIVLTHGILNILKVLLIFGLINILYFISSAGDISSLPLMELISLLKDKSTFESAWSIDDKVGFLGFILIVLIFLFGILPDFVKSMQENTNKASFQQKSLKENLSKKNLKTYSFFVFNLFFGFFLLEHTPPFIDSMIMLTFGISFSLFLTLKSINYSYDLKKLSIGLAVFFFLGSFLTFSLGKNEAFNHSLPLDVRIKSAAYLGDYGKEALKELVSEIAKFDEKSKDLGKTDLRSLFGTLKNKDMRLDLTYRIEKNCMEKKDHTCRLAAYLLAFDKKPFRLDLIKQSCPNDLYSCEVVRTNTWSSEQEIRMAEDHLIDICKNDQSGFEGKVCRNYFKSKEREKKNKT